MDSQFFLYRLSLTLTLLSLMLQAINFPAQHQHKPYSQLQTPPPHQSSRLLQIVNLNVQCNLIGCKNCIQNNVCESCIDFNNARVLQGHCICNVLHKQKPDSTGFCSTCIVPGCASCVYENENACYQCADQNALLRNGSCICPQQIQIFNREGFCHKCTVAGCEKCQQNNINFCQICIDSQRAQMINKKCFCRNRTEKPDSLGFCSSCVVPGCGSCVVSHQETCYKCSDRNAFLVNGLCKCPEGMHFNTQGQCLSCDVYGCNKCSRINVLACAQCIDEQDTRITDGICVCLKDREKIDSFGQCNRCNVLGCASCVAGKQNFCHKCVDPTLQIMQGSCMCKQNMTFNSFGLCHKCNVIGCDRCSSNSLDICEKCIDSSDTSIINGKCICQYSVQKPDKFGDCRTCFVPGCASCSFENQFECSICTDPIAVLLDGQCQCPKDFSFDSDGYCHKCNVLGCHKCVDGSSEICLQCLDSQDTQIVDGKCVCDRSTQKPNSLGHCTVCERDGCLSCLAQNKQYCYICIDERARLTEGQCICPEGQNFDRDGMCYPCKRIGCRYCEEDDQNVCNECVDKQNTDLWRGQCLCSNNQKIQFNLRPNSRGYCSECNIVGCSSCKADQDNITASFFNETVFNNHNHTQQCIRCLDVQAFVEDGICKCPDGKPLNPDGICRCRIPFCERCSKIDILVCIQCQKGYDAQLSGNCTPKLNNSKGLFVLQDAIQIEIGECMAGCFHCLDITYCTTCIDTYYLTQQNQCEKCNHRCSKCVSQSVCTQCYYSHYLSQQNSCLSCQRRNCLNCISRFNCIQCKEGYSAINGQCVKCLQNCDKCFFNATPRVIDGNITQDTPRLQCFDCKFGYTVLNGQCLQCMSTCTKCSFSSYATCEQCDLGYFLNSRSTCSRCHERCFNCTSFDECVECKQGYTLNDEGDCIFKQQNCTCLQCSQDNECEQCFEGYDFENGTCYPEKQLQSECVPRTQQQQIRLQLIGVQQEQCLICPQKYIYEDQKCVECEVEDVCLYCSNSNVRKCIQCASLQYYLNAGRCVRCQPQCITCLSQDICLQCKRGYFKYQVPSRNTSPYIDRSQGICVKCQQPCTTCYLQSTQCLSCIQGLSLVGWKCTFSVKVEFIIKLNISTSQFVNNQYLFFRELMAAIAFQNNRTEDDIIYNTIREGSTIINGVMKTQSDEEGTSILRDLRDTFNETSPFNNIPVLSTQYIAIGFTEIVPPPPPSPPPPQPDYFWVYFGVAFGLFVVLSLVIAICICRKLTIPEKQPQLQKLKFKQVKAKKKLKIGDAKNYGGLEV